MKGRVALVIAFLLAVIAVIVVRLYLKQQTDEIRQKSKPVPVLGAKRQMSIGTVLTAEDIDIVEIPQQQFDDDEDYFTQDQKDNLKGMKLPYGIKKGSAFRKSMWTAGGEDFTKPLVDDDKYRAITIGVDKISGIGNLIRDGSEVDIYCTYTTSPGEGGSTQQIMRTIPVLSNVYVLKTDRQSPMKGRAGGKSSMFSKGSSAVSDSYSTVTVKVKTEEVPVLTFAQKKGELTLVLRRKSSLDANIGKPVDQNSFETETREILRGRGSNPK